MSGLDPEIESCTSMSASRSASDKPGLELRGRAPVVSLMGESLVLLPMIGECANQRTSPTKAQAHQHASSAGWEPGKHWIGGAPQFVGAGSQDSKWISNVDW